MFTILRLGPDDVDPARKLNALFGEAFADADTYTGAKPDDLYLANLLAKDHVLALVAMAETEVLGGLVAYELDKFETTAREIYLYDLAVKATHRRRGIAHALICRLREIAETRRSRCIFVQADYGDDPAIALYTKMGTREDVMHFDIEVAPSKD